jgi:hypothetical protein
MVAVCDNATRKRFMETLMATGFTAQVVVSGRGFESPTATLGAGTVVLHGAVGGAYTRVGLGGVLIASACYPVAGELARRGLSLSPYAGLAEADVDRIVESLRIQASDLIGSAP